MQWLDIWNHLHCVITAGASPDLGNKQKSWVTAGLQTLPITQVMRHKTHPKWIAHPCQTFTRCFPTFICNRWAYGATIIALLLQVLAQIWEISRNPECKPYPLRKQWGLRPTQSGSHILGRHMPGGVLTFICNVWKYGAIIIVLSLPVLVQIWGISRNPKSLLDYKPYQ